MRNKDHDDRPVSLGEAAVWDENLGVFRVKVQGNRNVGSLTILRSAPFPIAHLDASAPRKQTRLGQLLRDRLEIEVNAAITRGSREVGDGLALLGPEDVEKLEP
jgi:hypothetical protein